MPEYITIQVWKDHATPVGETGDDVLVTNVGGDTIYYGDRQVTPTQNLGSLTFGQSVTLTAPGDWVRSGSLSEAQLTTTSRTFDPSLAAKLGTDGFVGGSGGSPLSASVVSGAAAGLTSVQAGTQPATGTGTFTYKYANPLSVPKQLPDPTVDAFAYCKGDGTIDDYANIMTALGVASTLASRYNVAVPVNVGNGLFGLSAQPLLPSFTGFMTPHGTRKTPGAMFQPRAGFTDTAGSYLIGCATSAQGCIMKGVGLYINSAFSNLGGLNFKCLGGTVRDCNITNSPLTALVVDGINNDVESNFFAGGALRVANSTTINGGSQTLPGPGSGTTTTLTVTDGTKANGAGGYAVVAGCSGLIAYTGVSGNVLQGVTGGIGTPANGAVIQFVTYTQASLSAYQGMGLHMPIGGEDNFIHGNEIAGDTIATLMMRTSQGYGCCVYTAHGGVDMLKDNLIETADTGLYFACPSSTGQEVKGNRIEVCNGHGVQFAANTGYSDWVGNKYSMNGLSQTDTYFHLMVDVNGINNSFTAERFRYLSGSSTFGTNIVAGFVCDYASTAATANNYDACDGLTTDYVSAPIVYLSSTNLPARSDVRAGFKRYNRFAATPVSGQPGTGGAGTFGLGDEWKVQAPANPVAGGNERMVAIGGGMSATTLTSVTAFGTAGTNVMTVSDGTKIPWGATLTIPGIGTAGASVFPVKVKYKNGNQITMDTTIITTVTSGSPVTLSFNGVTANKAGVIELKSTQSFSGLSAIAAGAQATIGTVTLNGAIVQNRAEASWTVALGGLRLWAEVTAANTVTLYMSNSTGGSLTPPNGVASVWVRA